MTTENAGKGTATDPADKKTTEEKQTQAQGNEELAKMKADLEKAQKHIAELNEENKKHRLGKKEVEELNEKQKKAIALLTGKSDETPDPAELQRKATDEKVRKAYLKAAFVTEAAKHMHDADFAFDAMARELADVPVNLETGEVDRKLIKDKLDVFKTSKPFLFVSTSNTNNGTTTTKPPPGNVDGNGQPSGGGNPYQQWKTLKADPLRSGEAQKFYDANRAAILANMK